ncbi:MAG: BrnA antitoxin family protein [Caldilineaceae bacterium]|nr:BrnA antitoxin family protein [Caldilineaceae bacterium]
MTKKAKLTKKRLADLQALEELPDDQIDTTDIPEILDWTGAKRGVLYRPVKQQITLRLDADVISWFKAHAQGGRGFQTDINRALREHVLRRERETTY